MHAVSPSPESARMPLVLIIGSAMWAGFWTLMAISVGYGFHVVSGTNVGSFWNIQWPLVAILALCTVSSVVALVSLASGRRSLARWALVVAGVTGLWNVLSMVLSFVALLLLRDRV